MLEVNPEAGYLPMQILAKSDGDPDDELLSVTTVKDGTLVSHRITIPAECQPCMEGRSMLPDTMC